MKFSYLKYLCIALVAAFMVKGDNAQAAASSAAQSTYCYCRWEAFGHYEHQNISIEPGENCADIAAALEDNPDYSNVRCFTNPGEPRGTSDAWTWPKSLLAPPPGH